MAEQKAAEDQHRQEGDSWRIPASINDQWNFLLKTIWDQMIHLVIQFEGAVDLPTLEQAVREAMAAEVLTTAKFTPGDSPFFEPAFPGSDTPSWDVITTAHPDIALSSLLGSSLDPLKGPMCRVRLIRSDNDLLCISFNHTMTDAYGVKSFGSLLASLYRSGRGKGMNPPLGNPHDRSLKSILSLFSGDELATAARRIRKREGAWNIPFESLNVGEGQYVKQTIGQPGFSSVRQFAHNHSVTINDLLLASFILALAKMAPPLPNTCNPVLTSIDLRRYQSLSFHHALSNFSVAFELPVMIPDHIDPTDVVRHIHTLMASCKSGHAGIGAAALLETEFDKGFWKVEEKLAEMEGKTRQGLSGKNPFFTNLGVIPEGVVDYGIPVRDAWMLGPVEYPPGLCLAASTFRDCLTLSMGYSGTALQKEWVISLLSAMAATLSGFTSWE